LLKSLGKGNYGIVCIAYLSHKTQFNNEENLKPFIQRQISSYKPENLRNNESIQLLSKLPKDAKKSAVKIAIDESTHSSNIDPLLQEFKIMSNISDPRNESHLNVIQLYAVCTSQLISHGTKLFPLYI
jgi:hypothetical protein